MNQNGVLIGVFVNKRNILSFLETVRNKYNIPYQKIFVYEIDTNDKEYIVTFKVRSKDVVYGVKNSTVIHIKSGCIFSINALNKLISSKKSDDSVPNSEYEINWDEYRDSIIMLSGDELKISKISKIEDKSLFFLR